jgi:hypothetical protein
MHTHIHTNIHTYIHRPFLVEQLKDDEFDNMGIADEDAKVYIHRIVKK